MSLAQSVPSAGENLDFLVTFGQQSQKSWGDDDFCQIFFFLVPENNNSPVYIRVFDPDVGGKYDNKNNGFNTQTKFTVYGGKSSFSEDAARAIDPIPNYNKGVVLASETFGSSSKYNDDWYTFGPFNPTEGEYSPEFRGYVFKVIAQGLSGDDGNLYRYFFSSSETQNTPVRGGNAFTYEYSFRLKSTEKAVANLYPFLDKDVISIKQFNFDFDGDGNIKLFSVRKNGHNAETSGDNNWATSEHQIEDAEKNRSLNVQIIKRATFDNDMVMYVTNQYDVPLPFFALPLGGPPKYEYFIDVQNHIKNR